MKKLFSTAHFDKNIDAGILLIRIALAALMLSHGIPKMMGLFSGGPVQFPPLFGLSPEISLGLAVFAEVLCSLLILVGFGTRLAAIPLIITMLVAVFYIHGADPFVKKELGIHYLIGYVLLFITGSGKYSLDHVIGKKKIAISYTS